MSVPPKGVLGEEEFRRLVAGDVIELQVRGDYNGRVLLLLSDIGYGRMLQAIRDAETEREADAAYDRAKRRFTEEP